MPLLIMLTEYLCSYLDESTQNRFVEQLYWSSVFQQRFLNSESGSSIDYSLCWRKLTRHGAFDESGSMTSRRFHRGRKLVIG